MKQKRAKSYKKQMLVYLNAFKFREPFQVLVDDQIILESEKTGFALEKGLRRTIQGEVKPMITQCCIQSLYNTKNNNAISIAKSYERRRCNHPPTAPLDPKDCMESVVNVSDENKHRYVVATQNIDLRKSLRQIPGVPIIHINRSVMVMEPLSKKSQEFSANFEARKLSHGLNDIKSGRLNNAEEKDPSISKKRKGPKGPNPLSVKSKKPRTDVREETLQKPKRKRTHSKKPAKESKD